MNLVRIGDTFIRILNVNPIEPVSTAEKYISDSIHKFRGILSNWSEDEFQDNLNKFDKYVSTTHTDDKGKSWECWEQILVKGYDFHRSKLYYNN